MVRGPRCGAIALACLALAPAARAAPTFVQGQCIGVSNTTTASLAFPAANQAGDLSIVSVDFGGTSPTVNSVKDTQGNVYLPASSLVTDVGQGAQTWYSANIRGGANTVTVVISSASNGKLNLYIHEFSGASSVDIAISSSGVSSSPASGSVTTHFAEELIYGHCVFGGSLSGVGSGFAQLTACNGNITEAETGAVPGSYQATFAASSPNIWAATMVSFRPAASVDAGNAPDSGAGLDAGGNLDAGFASDGGAVTGHDGGATFDSGRADAAVPSDGGSGGDVAPSEFTVGCGCGQSPVASWAILAALSVLAIGTKRARCSERHIE
jgi:hypothetical protein